MPLTEQVVVHDPVASGGLLLFVFRFCKKTPAEWCSYAILLMNVCSPLIERVTGHKSFGEVKK